jgi:hypothetical protein
MGPKAVRRARPASALLSFWINPVGSWVPAHEQDKDHHPAQE